MYTDREQEGRKVGREVGREGGRERERVMLQQAHSYGARYHGPMFMSMKKILKGRQSIGIMV